MGAVGRAVARRLVGFGIGQPILFFDPHPEAAASLGPSVQTEAVASLADLLSASDVVLPLLPLNEETTHLIDDRAIKLMKRGAYLINCGRG
jgi:phosphoglycerate dehydrogenase-like enzyme